MSLKLETMTSDIIPSKIVIAKDPVYNFENFSVQYEYWLNFNTQEHTAEEENPAYVAWYAEYGERTPEEGETFPEAPAATITRTYYTYDRLRINTVNAIGTPNEVLSEQLKAIYNTMIPPLEAAKLIALTQEPITEIDF